MFVYFRKPYTGTDRVAQLVVNSEGCYRDRLMKLGFQSGYIDVLVLANKANDLVDLDRMVPASEPETFSHLVAYAQYAVEQKNIAPAKVSAWINEHLPGELREPSMFPAPTLPAVGGPRFDLQPNGILR